MLEQRLGEGENEHQDFKFCITDSRKLAETISAFSNARGGSIFIGVKDNGKIKGVDPEEEGYMAEAAASLYCSPVVVCTFKVWETTEGNVLEVLVPEAPDKPVMAKTSDEKLKPFFRVKDINHLAPWALTECWKMSQNPNPLGYRHTPRDSKIFTVMADGNLVSQKQLERRTRIPRPILNKLLGKLLCWDVIKLDWGPEGPLFRLNTESPLDLNNLAQSNVPLRNNRAMEK